MYFPSVYFRKRAREALKGRWQTALLIALIVNLPMLLVQGISAVTVGAGPLTRLQNMTIDYYQGLITQDMLVSETAAFLKSRDFLMSVGMSVAAWLITPFMTLGMIKWLMDALRKQPEGPVSTVFCRAKLFFKAIGLQLLIVLKTLLWMLPGMGLCFLLSLIPAEQGSVGSVYAVLILPLIGAIIVPAVLALLRYAMAEFILADEPETRITECVRRSKEQMQDNKKMFVLLMLSFILWYLFRLLIASSLPGVIGLVADMLIGLVLYVYVTCAESCFYLETRLGRIPKHDTPKSAGSETDDVESADTDKRDVTEKADRDTAGPKDPDDHILD